MKRFYDRAIKSLLEIKQRENADDIDAYVKHVEHERSVLISELSRAGTSCGNKLLKEMGY